MKKLALLILILPFQSFAASFMFGGSTGLTPALAPQVKIIPPSPTRPTRKPVTVPAAPAVASDDSKSEATAVCATCAKLPPRPLLAKIDPTHIAGADTRTPATSSASDCMRKVLLESAKSVARTKYGNRPYSVGKCARGVGNMLRAAGLSKTNSIGDAISFHNAGHLRRLGFKNIMHPGMTPEKAPPGAVLVFRGPMTVMSHYNGGLPRRRFRRGRGAGTWVGHITIKGEVADRYYTDGRTEDPAVANRFLVAVYVPETCGANCSGKARACLGN